MRQSVAVGLTLVASAQAFAPHGGLIGHRQQRTAKLRQGSSSGSASVQGYGVAGSSSRRVTSINKADSVGALSLGGERAKARSPWWKLSASPSADVAGEDGVGSEAGEDEKPKKKRAAPKKASTTKKKVKKPSAKDKPAPATLAATTRERVVISLDDLDDMEQGRMPTREEEFPDGWEFVDDDQENDENDEVPYWSGPEPALTEAGKLVGIAPEAVRIAGKAIASKQAETSVRVSEDDDFNWYLLRCFATYELRCANAVESFLHAYGLGDQVDQIWVPTRQVPKQIGKNVKFKEEPIYQGYIYCRVRMDERLRNLVNDMDRIVGFVGTKRDEDKRLIPNRLDDEDIEGVRASEKDLAVTGTPKLLSPGDLVEIVEGPYAMQKGEVAKVRDGAYVVKVNMLGRNSDVKLSWDGARKLTELEQETWFEETRRVRK